MPAAFASAARDLRSSSDCLPLASLVLAAIVSWRAAFSLIRSLRSSSSPLTLRAVSMPSAAVRLGRLDAMLRLALRGLQRVAVVLVRRPVLEHDVAHRRPPNALGVFPGPGPLGSYLGGNLLRFRLPGLGDLLRLLVEQVADPLRGVLPQRQAVALVVADGLELVDGQRAPRLDPAADLDRQRFQPVVQRLLARVLHLHRHQLASQALRVVGRLVAGGVGLGEIERAGLHVRAARADAAALDVPGLDVHRLGHPVPPLFLGGVRPGLLDLLPAGLGALLLGRDVLGGGVQPRGFPGARLGGDPVVVQLEHTVGHRPLGLRAAAPGHLLHGCSGARRQRLRLLVLSGALLGRSFVGGFLELGLARGAPFRRLVHRLADGLRHRRAAPGDFAYFGCRRAADVDVGLGPGDQARRLAGVRRATWRWRR